MSHGAVEPSGLLGLVSRELTPDLIHRAALQLGENEDRTRSALSTSIPSVLTTLSDVASSTDGARHLSNVIHKVDSRSDTGSARLALRLQPRTRRRRHAVRRRGGRSRRTARGRGRAHDRREDRFGAQAARRRDRRGAAGAGRNFGSWARRAAVAAARAARRFREEAPGSGRVALQWTCPREGGPGRGERRVRAVTARAFVTGPAIREIPHPKRGGGSFRSCCSRRWA